jgi:tRNA threonylcarbamoyl adenosine modification protein YeaZ
MSNQKYGLAIHTSSGQLGLGLLDLSQDNQIVAFWDLDRLMSSHFHQYLKEFIKDITWQDLAFIGVATGPGSFTSIRIGMIVARTLAQQLDIPLIPVSTLASLAQHQVDNSSSGDDLIAAQISANSESYYVALYQKDPERGIVVLSLPDQNMKSEDWQETLNQIESPYFLITGENRLGYTVGSLLKLAHKTYLQGDLNHWRDALPYYPANNY